MTIQLLSCWLTAIVGYVIAVLLSVIWSLALLGHDQHASLPCDMVHIAPDVHAARITCTGSALQAVQHLPRMHARPLPALATTA